MPSNRRHEGPAPSIAMLVRKSKTSAPDDRTPAIFQATHIYIDDLVGSDQRRSAGKASRVWQMPNSQRHP
jgi:hypothetical protein